MLYSKLKKMMRKKGKTVRVLAEDAGVSASTILRLSKSEGIEGSNLYTLKKISIALGCRVKDLVDDKK
jgi:DNA-binding Xre family transcriptional regulator